MAPEQLQGRRADARADQFAFCVTLFEALFSGRPFSGTTIKELARNVVAGKIRAVDASSFGVPQALMDALRRGLASDPEERYPSMEKLLDAIETAVTAPPRRRSWLMAASGFAALLVAGSLALAGTAGAPDPEPRRNEPESRPSPPAPPNAELFEASNLPKPLPTSDPADPLATTIHRLSNGITVYIATMRDRPRIWTGVVVRAGSSDERRGSRGVAHLLEHMMFNGTAKVGSLDWTREQPLLQRRDALASELEATSDPDERDHILENIEEVTQEAAQWAVPKEHAETLARLGAGPVQATVSSEHTTFFVDVPSPRFEAWARLEAERLRHPAFRAFFPELSVVVEEMRMNRDGRGEAFDAARELLYAGSSLAFDPAGHIEDLSRPPFAAMREFHRDFYVPNNAAIVLVGDIDAQRALPVLEAEFGEWKPAPLNRPPPAAPLGPGVRRRTVSGALPFPLLVAWRAPEPQSDDEPALELLVDAINDRQGWFQGEFVERGPLDVVASSLGGGLFVVYASPDESGALGKAEAAVTQALRRIADGHLPPSFLETLEQRRTLRWLEATSDPGSVGLALAAAYGEGRSWPREIDARARYTSLDVDDVAATARALLDQGRAVVRQSDDPYVPPPLSLPALAPLDYPTGTQSSFARAVEAMPATRLEPQFLSEGRDYRISDASWGRVIANQVPGELYRFDLVFSIGSDVDPYVCHAVDLWERAGIPGLARDELEAELGVAGIRIDLACDRRHARVTISGTERTREAAWSLVQAWLTESRIDDPLLSDRERLGREWQTLYAVPANLFRALQDYARYRDHSTPMTIASNRVMKNVPASRLDQSLRRLRASPRTILYSGPLESVPLGTELAATEVSETPRVPSGPHHPARDEILLLDDPRRDQARVELIFVSPPLNPEDRATTQMWETYFGKSMSGMILGVARGRVG